MKIIMKNFDISTGGSICLIIIMWFSCGNLKKKSSELLKLYIYTVTCKHLARLRNANDDISIYIHRPFNYNELHNIIIVAYHSPTIGQKNSIDQYSLI